MASILSPVVTRWGVDSEKAIGLVLELADSIWKELNRPDDKNPVVQPGVNSFDMSVIYRNAEGETSVNVPGLNDFRKRNQRETVHLCLGFQQAVFVIPPYDETKSIDNLDTIQVAPKVPTEIASNCDEKQSDVLSIQGDVIYAKLPDVLLGERVKNPTFACCIDLGPGQVQCVISSHERMEYPAMVANRHVCTIAPSLISAEELRRALVDTGTLADGGNRDFTSAANALNSIKDESTAYYHHKAESIYNAVVAGLKKYDPRNAHQHGEWDTVTHSVGMIYEHAARCLRGEIEKDLTRFRSERF